MMKKECCQGQRISINFLLSNKKRKKMPLFCSSSRFIIFCSALSTLNNWFKMMMMIQRCVTCRRNGTVKIETSNFVCVHKNFGRKVFCIKIRKSKPKTSISLTLMLILKFAFNKKNAPSLLYLHQKKISAVPDSMKGRTNEHLSPVRHIYASIVSILWVSVNCFLFDGKTKTTQKTHWKKQTQWKMFRLYFLLVILEIILWFKCTLVRL